MTQDGEGADDSDPHMLRLGGYIKVQRQLADLSLRRLADMTQVSNAYLSQIERGLHQPSIRVLRSIATALNVSADTLLTQAGLLDPAATGDGRDGMPGDDADGTGRPGAGPDGNTGSEGNADAPIGTEEAIRRDPALSDEERAALIRIYRSFTRSSG